jgi:hypothetical protein
LQSSEKTIKGINKYTPAIGNAKSRILEQQRASPSAMKIKTHRVFDLFLHYIITPPMQSMKNKKLIPSAATGFCPFAGQKRICT